MTREQKEYSLALIICLGVTLYVGKGIYEIIMEDPAPKMHVEVVYDCRLAEISPDYPVVVKEKCRKILVPVISRVK